MEGKDEVPHLFFWDVFRVTVRIFLTEVGGGGRGGRPERGHVKQHNRILQGEGTALAARWKSNSILGPCHVVQSFETV